MYNLVVLNVAVVLLGYFKCIEGAEKSDLQRTSYPWYSDSISPDDIRCYCNLSKCVATGYMCRTARSKEVGGCFSEVRDNNDKSVARHGCIELLHDYEQPIQCDNSPRKHVEKSSSGSSSLLLCCYDDMCNHVDSKKLNLMTDKVDDDALLASGSQQTDNHFEKQQQYPNQLKDDTPLSQSDYNGEIWFKAATIAVPICGAVILFILIGLAIKILKTDTIDSPKLDGSSCSSNRKSQVDCEAYGPHEYSSKALPLLKHSTIYGNNMTICRNDLKNEHLAKKNQIMSLQQYDLLPQSCNDPANKPTNTYVGCVNLHRNINLSPSVTSRVINDKKVYDKEVLSPTSYCTGANSNYGK